MNSTGKRENIHNHAKPKKETNKQKKHHQNHKPFNIYLFRIILVGYCAFPMYMTIKS